MVYLGVCGRRNDSKQRQNRADFLAFWSTSLLPFAVCPRRALVCNRDILCVDMEIIAPIHPGLQHERNENAQGGCDGGARAVGGDRRRAQRRRRQSQRAGMCVVVVCLFFFLSFPFFVCLYVCVICLYFCPCFCVNVLYVVLFFPFFLFFSSSCFTSFCVYFKMKMFLFLSN